MFDFEKPNIEIAEISEDKRYGKFVVEPLERGYGTTLGNSLRRIMLSSLPGAAVSFVLITLSDFEIALNSVFFKFGLEFFSLRRTADCASLRLIRRRFRPRMNVLRRRRSCFLRLGFSARCQNKYKCG